MKMLAVAAAIMLSACGGGGADAPPDRYMQVWSGQTFRAEQPTGDCAALVAELRALMPAELLAYRLECSADHTSTPVPWTGAVRLSNGTLMAWYSPSQQQCTAFQLSLEQRGMLALPCAVGR